MPRRPDKVTQGEIARVIRAAQEAGAAEVIIDGEGQIPCCVITKRTGGFAFAAEGRRRVNVTRRKD